MEIELATKTQAEPTADTARETRLREPEPRQGMRATSPQSAPRPRG